MDDSNEHDCRLHILAFCIADVPVAVLNSFLRDAEDVDENSICFRIMDSFEFDTEARGHDTKNPVSDNFVSPFQGWSIKKVKKWFNIHVKERSYSCARGTFVIIDEHVRRAKDEEDLENGTVILCDTQTQMLKTVRLKSTMALGIARDLDFKMTMRDDPLGVFWRSRTTCSEEGFMLVRRNGIYFHKGVPEIDEEWRAFNQKWQQGGPEDFDSASDSDTDSDNGSEPPMKRLKMGS